MDQSGYFVIGALLASLVIGVATSYICTTLDAFSEVNSDEEFRRLTVRRDSTEESAHRGAQTLGEDSTQLGDGKRKERTG